MRNVTLLQSKKIHILTDKLVSNSCYFEQKNHFTVYVKSMLFKVLFERNFTIPSYIYENFRLYTCQPLSVKLWGADEKHLWSSVFYSLKTFLYTRKWILLTTIFVQIFFQHIQKFVYVFSGDYFWRRKFCFYKSTCSKWPITLCAIIKTVHFWCVGE